ACGGTDCDDADANRHPGNRETCSASYDQDHDEDCNPRTFGDLDQDGDGFVSSICCNEEPYGIRDCGRDCDDSNPHIHPGAVEACDHLDNDCNGAVDDGVDVALYPDADGDNHGTPGTERGCPGEPGYALLDNDCDDSNPAIQPGSILCN